MDRPHCQDELLFSIVVAAYNAGQTIRSTIDSVLTQTCQQAEVIVIDGRSADGTTEVLRSYNGNQKVRWISEPDDGIYDAMNKGTSLARGRYVLFLGADDRLYSNDTLQCVADRITAESDVMVGNIVYTNGNVFTSSISPLLYLLNTMHHQGVFYRRDVLLEHPYDSSWKICGDYELNLFLYKSGFNIQKIEQLVSICGYEGVTKKVLFQGSLEEIEFKRRLFGTMLYPLNAVFVMAKFLVRKAIKTL